MKLKMFSVLHVNGPNRRRYFFLFRRIVPSLTISDDRIYLSDPLRENHLSKLILGLPSFSFIVKCVSLIVYVPQTLTSHQPQKLLFISSPMTPTLLTCSNSSKSSTSSVYSLVRLGTFSPLPETPK